MNRWTWVAAAWAAAATAAPAPPELQLDGDHMTLVAKDQSVGDILGQFQRFGVAVEWDPAIARRVTGAYVDEPVAKVIDRLAGENSYILSWDVWAGPLGDIPRLAAIQLFRPGHKDDLQPLAGGRPRLRLARALDGRGPEFVADEMLIGVKGKVSMDEFRRLIAQLGGTIVGVVRNPGVYLIRFGPNTNIPALLDQARGNPLVAYAEPNYVARLPAGSSTLDGAGATRPLAAPVDGAARVAVLDSGLMAGTGVDGTVVDRYDAMYPDQPLGDNAGHGTQMAMVAAGAVEPRGAADDGEAVPLIAIRAFDDAGVTSNFALMRAIDRAISSGAKVINLSWGSENDSEFIRSAIGYAQDQGLVVVAAAGNEPTGKPYYPSSYPGVVAVSAMEASGQLWAKSNYGDTVTVAAPGTASFPVGYNGDPGSYAGTSIASAYTARALALYFTAHPTATAADATKALQASVTDAGAAGRDPYYGYGALDAAALARLLGTK
jgi:thermitase